MRARLQRFMSALRRRWEPSDEQMRAAEKVREQEKRADRVFVLMREADDSVRGRKEVPHG